MAKHKPHKVVAPKMDDRLHIHIKFTARDCVTINRAARRQEAIDAGTLNANRASTHGGTDQQRNKRNRRQGKHEARCFQRGDYD